MAALSASCSHACRSRSLSPTTFPRAVVAGDDGDEFADACGEDRETDGFHLELVAFDGREEIDVADQAGHAVELGDADVARRDDVVPVVRVHDLQVPAHDRDRRLQFVPHIVQELTLHIDRAFEAFEHLVDGARHVRDVVVALRTQAG